MGGRSSPCEPGDEMKRTAKPPVQPPGIESKPLLPLDDAQTEVIEGAAPLTRRPVDAGHRYPEAPIADAIHEAQGWTREETGQQVILDHQTTGGDAICFPQQLQWLAGVMQNIRQHYCAKGAIAIGKMDAIKRIDWDGTIHAGLNFDALNPQVRAQLKNCRTQPTIAGTEVQHGRIVGQQPCEPFRQPTHAPPVDNRAVQ